ncbi:MAG: hypothetical protein J5I93_19270 [Pirellulaceae bacterium]|nr:hypothetical protein [Pirellulaceae bacterium]
MVAARSCRRWMWTLPLILAAAQAAVPLALAAEQNGPAAGKATATAGEAPEYETLTVPGRIVWMAEALQRRFGIQSVPEARERLMAIETPAGQLHPLVDDVRGRSFRLDPRLRVRGKFLVRRYAGSPMVQVIRTFEITDQGQFELDYWCDICSIAMFELKPCDCCQGPIELRRQRVSPDDAAAPPVEAAPENGTR